LGFCQLDILRVSPELPPLVVVRCAVVVIVVSDRLSGSCTACVCLDSALGIGATLVLVLDLRAAFVLAAVGQTI
jgi:hypothetical protein